MGVGASMQQNSSGEGKGETDNTTSDGSVFIVDSLLVYHTTRDFFKLLFKTWMNIWFSSTVSKSTCIR